MAGMSAKIKTETFCEQSAFVFPVMYDEDNSIRDLYSVSSTPTIVLIGPDGVVDSIGSAEQEIGTLVEESHRRIFAKSAS